MNKRYLLMAGLFLLVAGLAFAYQTPMRQGYYFTAIGGNDADIGLVRAEVSGVPTLQFQFTTSDTVAYTLDDGSFDLADSNALVLGTGTDLSCNPDGTNVDCTIANGVTTFGDGGTTNYMSLSATGAAIFLGSSTVTLNDAVELRFGTAGADGECASDGTNIDCTITALMTFGDGGTTNYSSISATGAMIGAGSATWTLNDNVEIKFGTAGAESEIASNGTATTWTQTSGDLNLGTGGFVQKLGGALVLSTWQAWGGTDTTPDVSGYSYFTTDASTQTLTDFDGSGIAAGQIIVVESTAAVTYDVTTSGLICGDTDVITADGDVTMWIYNGTDWICLAFHDLDDNSNTWGAA